MEHTSPPKFDILSWAGFLFISAALLIAPLCDKYAFPLLWTAFAFFAITFILVAISLSARARIIRLLALAVFIIIYGALLVKPLLAIVIVKNLSFAVAVIFISAVFLNAALVFIPKTSKIFTVIDCALTSVFSIYCALALKNSLLFAAAFVVFVSIFFISALKKRELFLPYTLALAIIFFLAPLAFVSNSSVFYSLFDRFLPTRGEKISPYVSRLDKAVEESVDFTRLLSGLKWSHSDDTVITFEMNPVPTGRLSVFVRENSLLSVKRFLGKLITYNGCVFSDFAYVPLVDAMVRIDSHGNVLEREFLLREDVGIQALLCDRKTGRAMLVADLSGELYIYREGNPLPELVLFSPRPIDRFLGKFHFMFIDYPFIAPMAIGATFFPDGKIGVLAHHHLFSLYAFVLDQNLNVIWQSEPFFGSYIGWVAAIDDKMLVYQNLSGKVRVLDTKTWEFEEVPKRIEPSGGHIMFYDDVGKFLIVPFYDGRIAFIDPDTFETFEIAYVGMRTHVPQLLADERLLVVTNFSGIFKVDLKAVDEIYKGWKSSRGVQNSIHK